MLASFAILFRIHLAHCDYHNKSKMIGPNLLIRLFIDKYVLGSLKDSRPERASHAALPLAKGRYYDDGTFPRNDIVLFSIKGWWFVEATISDRQV